MCVHMSVCTIPYYKLVMAWSIFVVSVVRPGEYSPSCTSFSLLTGWYLPTYQGLCPLCIHKVPQKGYKINR